jgi:tungstate transport system substrate-binding protein
MDRNLRKTIGIVIALMCVAALLMTMLMGASCNNNDKKTEIKQEDRKELILATTTSTQDTGLLDEWIPMFEENNAYSTKVVAVGSGAAMDMGRKGEADVLLVHSPADEEKLVADGYGIERAAVMHNDFIVVGPPSDPAGIKGMTNAADAFKKIAESQSTFISRGDNSGTHSKEKAVWKAAGITPSGDWYIESGKGMGDTLKIADEKNAYTLADRGTYLAQKSGLDLIIMVEGDKVLQNFYHVIVVNPEKYPDIQVEGARAFAAFVVSPEAQEYLNEFGVDKYGEPLFFPDAL